MNEHERIHRDIERRERWRRIEEVVDVASRLLLLPFLIALVGFIFLRLS